MHNQPPRPPLSSVPEHSVTRGVVCAHQFGVGVYLLDVGDFGHVNVPALGMSTPGGLDDFPPVGTLLSLTVFNRGAYGQLRLGVTASP